MSEYRFDPLHQTWTVVAQERSSRPADFLPNKPRRRARYCPVCAGAEAETPPEILRLGMADYLRIAGAVGDERAAAKALSAKESDVAVAHADAFRHDAADASLRDTNLSASDTGLDFDLAQWLVRVIPNRFPAVNHLHGAPTVRRASQTWIAGSVVRERPGELRGIGPAVGKHEVVVESPTHCASLSDADETTLPLTFAAYRARLAEFAADRRLAYACVFKNVGPEAGATLEHLHSQLVALPMAPPHVETVWQAAWEHRRKEKECLTCRLMAEELADGSRIVAETDRFVAWCPFASRFAYEVCVAPKRHSADFHRIDDAGLMEFSGLVRQIASSLERTIGQPQYNFVLQTAPFGGDVEDCLHWRLEILPRTSKAAGFEWGTQCFINPTSPESAARFYRESSASGIGVDDSAACDAEFH